MLRVNWFELKERTEKYYKHRFMTEFFYPGLAIMVGIFILACTMMVMFKFIAEFAYWLFR